MKLLLLTEFFPESNRPKFTGGVEARAYFINKFLKVKHKIFIVSSSSNLIAANTFSIFPRLLFQFTAVIKALKFKPDIIEGSNFVSYLPAFVSSKLLGVPSVAWFADVYGKDWFQNFSFPTALSGYLIESVSLKLSWTRFIAMSQSTKHKLIAKGVDSKKITVVYGGVDLAAIKKAKVNKYKTPTICTAARLVSYKRLQDLIRAVNFVNLAGYRLNLIIMGEGPFKSELEKLSNNLCLDQKIKFTGSISHDQVINTIKSCHLFSLPSVIEGFGLVTIEAAACGTPFINSAISPTVEVTHNGQGGLLFKPQDPKDLSTKIIKLLTNKKLYQTKKSQGLKLAQRYDWSIIAKQTQTVYSKALSVKY